MFNYYVPLKYILGLVQLCTPLNAIGFYIVLLVRFQAREIVCVSSKTHNLDFAVVSRTTITDSHQRFTMIHG